MALNWTMLGPDRSPVPLPHEMTITTVDSGVELQLTVPDAPPSASGTSGGSGGSKKLKEVGRVWITDQRFIFVGSEKSDLESLSVPLYQIISTKFEQPMFGTNYLVLEIAPSSDGGLTRGTTAEIRFKDQALFGFVRILEKTREHAIETRQNNQAAADEADGLPAYSSSGPAGPSSTSGSGSSAPPPPPPSVPDDAPPGYDA